MDLLVNIDVDNLVSAENFYCTALDLRVGRRLGHDTVELLGCSAPIYLLAKPDGSNPSGVANLMRTYDRHWTPIHLDFVVPDIERAVRKAVAAGAALEQPIQTLEWGRIAVLADPFGHGLCLLQFLARGYDEISTA